MGRVVAVVTLLFACCVYLVAQSAANVDKSPARPAASVALTPELIDGFRKDFASNPRNITMQNAIGTTSVDALSLNRAVVASTDHTFSNTVDNWKATAQNKSGRCWIFAGCNVLRAACMKNLENKDFELSQNYMMFWDKLEKCNYFLEAMIETAGRDVDDRTVDYLIGHPVGDGGQWNMFANLIEKYGVVPKSAMPETESSSNSGSMNKILTTKLRQYAMALRNAYAAKASPSELSAMKQDMMNVLHRVLCIHLGTPPKTFFWQWKDKKDNFHRDGEMTPKEFAQKYLTTPLDEYVCLVDDPRKSNPKGKVYTVEYLGNVAGGEPVRYLNVEIELIKELTMKAILDGEPVWFGCDTGKMMSRDLGLWDEKLFDFEGIYGTSFASTKEERLLYGQSQMNHAMVFTGVDVVDGKPRKWRVENSWGKEPGQEGFFTMNDNWFDEYVFEIAVHKDMLPEKYQKVLNSEATVLPAWDPMGSLARE
ncbi:MAG: C1 family peptidase [Planctomycetes bacterium]|nr:C1 family peptidase [Planctomycetota bacterium]NUQ36040.1 C1 family peptidase [Planctomycetaceae bacterium]